MKWQQEKAVVSISIQRIKGFSSIPLRVDVFVGVFFQKQFIYTTITTQSRICMSNAKILNTYFEMKKKNEKDMSMRRARYA